MVPLPRHSFHKPLDCRLQIYKDIVGTAAFRVEVDAPGKWPNTWQKTGVVIDAKDDPELDNDKFRKDISQGAEHMLQESIVTCTDPHYDAASDLYLARYFAPCAGLLWTTLFTLASYAPPRMPSCGCICTHMGQAVSSASLAPAVCTDSRVTVCS
jgi:hypothetical protein